MTETAPEVVKNVRPDGRFSETVIAAVAEAKGVDPLRLDPIYTVLDPDALDNLFHPTIGATPSTLEVNFSMAGCQVTVHGDGDVVVTQPLENEGRQSTIVSSDD